MVPARGPGRTSRSTQDEDVRTVHGLAHPLRVRLLAALRADGPATATELGRRLGVSSGSTSYHLRQLARYGFVGDDEHQPSRRERRWRSLHARTWWSPGWSAGHAPDTGAGAALTSQQVQRAAQLAQRWLDARRTWPDEWMTAAGFSDCRPRLTPSALAMLGREITTLVGRYEQACAGDPGAEPVHLSVLAVPATDEQSRTHRTGKAETVGPRPARPVEPVVRGGTGRTRASARRPSSSPET